MGSLKRGEPHNLSKRKEGGRNGHRAKYSIEGSLCNQEILTAPAFLKGGAAEEGCYLGHIVYVTVRMCISRVTHPIAWGKLM